MSQQASAEAGDEKWLGRLLTLLPGFLAVALARYVGALGEVSEFELTLYSLALSLVIFFLAAIVQRTLRAASSWRRHPRCDVGHSRAPLAFPPPLSLSFIAIVLLLSLASGGVLAGIYGSESILRLVRALPVGKAITKRSSARPSHSS